jgi:hypothetical protein
MANIMDDINDLEWYIYNGGPDNGYDLETVLSEFRDAHTIAKASYRGDSVNLNKLDQIENTIISSLRGMYQLYDRIEQKRHATEKELINICKSKG